MPKKVKETFGPELRALREARGLKQYEVAELLGRTPGRVSQWEANHQLPDDVQAKTRILEVVAAMPNVRGEGAADGFDFARYARLYKADEALRSAVNAVDDINEEWTEPWMSPVEQLHGRVKTEMLGCAVTEGE